MYCIAIYSYMTFQHAALYDIQLTSSIQVKVEFSGVSQDVRTTFSFHVS